MRHQGPASGASHHVWQPPVARHSGRSRGPSQLLSQCAQRSAARRARASPQAREITGPACDVGVVGGPRHVRVGAEHG
eukprot:scaffold68069_cov71-Phaeocystis_antarctica.AAC.5